MHFLRKLFGTQDSKVKKIVQNLVFQSPAVASSRAAWERFERANPLLAAMGIPIFVDAPPPEFLAKLREKDNLELQLSNAKKAEENVRVQATIKLGDLRDPEAVQPLIVALKDEYLSVRISAAEALGKIGDTRAVEPLTELIQKDLGDAVRVAAEQSLQAIQNTRV